MCSLRAIPFQILTVRKVWSSVLMTTSISPVSEGTRVTRTKFLSSTVRAGFLTRLISMPSDSPAPLRRQSCLVQTVNYLSLLQDRVPLMTSLWDLIQVLYVATTLRAKHFMCLYVRLFWKDR